MIRNGRPTRVPRRDRRAATCFAPGDWIAGTPYRVVRTLGVGGMGEVYEVDHTRTGTRRAVKVVRASLDTQAAVAQRLLREGRALLDIEHPNVVRVFEVGSLADGRPYFAMELIEGVSLRRVLAERAPLPWPRAVALVIQALDGLAAIHARGMIHRDVKPANLLLAGHGQVKVLDLGIAKPTDPHASGPRTRQGIVVGTTRYMAPEQLTARPVDARTDVYAAALVLFELLTGCHPADAVTGGELDPMARVDREPPAISLWVPEPLPGGFDAVMQRALAVNPDERFESAEAFARSLRVFVSMPERAPARAGVPVARVQYESRPPCAETTDATTVPMASRRPGGRTEAARWALVHTASVALSVFALAVAFVAIGVTWMAVRDLRWSRERCAGEVVRPFDGSGVEHVGAGAADR